VSCALSNDFLNSSNENGRLHSSKFFHLKFNLVFSFCFFDFWNFEKHPTSDNLGNIHIFRAKARRTLKQNRRTSWRNFVSKLNCHTPMNKVWNMVQKIKGAIVFLQILWFKIQFSFFLLLLKFLKFGIVILGNNLCNFRIFRAKARRTLKQNRRTSWRNFVSKLNCNFWSFPFEDFPRTSVRTGASQLCQIYTV
jgi:hypothetical protein